MIKSTILIFFYKRSTLLSASATCLSSTPLHMTSRFKHCHRHIPALPRMMSKDHHRDQEIPFYEWAGAPVYPEFEFQMFTTKVCCRNKWFCDQYLPSGQNEDPTDFEDLSVHDCGLEKAREGRMVLSLQRVALLMLSTVAQYRY